MYHKFGRPSPGSMRSAISLGAWLAVLTFSSPALTEPISDTKCPAEAVNGTPAGVIASMQKGFNLPGWVDQSRFRRPKPELLASLAKAGFTHVRLPFGPQLLSSSFETAFFKELDAALDQLIALGFTVSLDNHPGSIFLEGYEKAPDKGYARLLSAWLTIAGHVKARNHEKVFFELWNEPPIDPTLWRGDASKLIAALREVDPERTIIYGEAPYQRYDATIGTDPLPFRNVVYAVHYYDPMIFTHQGAEWMKGEPVAVMAGVPFPSTVDDPRLKQIEDGLVAKGHAAASKQLAVEYQMPWTVARIDGELAKLGDWAESHGIHVIINEFGVLKRTAPTESRVAWLKTVTQAAEKNCMGWAHWELLDAFGFVGADGRTLDPGVTDALLTR